MKHIRILILICMTMASIPSWAWISTAPTVKEYGFKFKMTDKDSYEYVTKAQSYEDAFERAAQACFTHYKGGRRVSEDRGLDIIDVCANPRKI